jgi:predicted dehydrogenase
MAGTLRLGVIGLGAGAEPHLRSLADLSDRAQVLLAVTPSETRAAARRASLPFPVLTDVHAVIDHPDVEAVILITPPATHRDLACDCLAAGKHVLVEKPIGLTVADGQQMVDTALRHRRRLGVMLQHRLRPGAQRLRAVLRDGMLGEIVAASVTVDWWRPQAYYDEPGRGTMARDGGGVLLTQAIHSIDLFRSLVGVSSVTAAQAVTTAVHRMETEDHVHALVTLENGAPGVITATTAAYPGGPEQIQILGTAGAARLVGGTLTISLHDGRTEQVLAEGKTGSGANIMDFPHDAHRAVIADFCDAIAQDRDPAVPGHEAVASQRLIEDILAVARRTNAR